MTSTLALSLLLLAFAPSPLARLTLAILGGVAALLAGLIAHHARRRAGEPRAGPIGRTGWTVRIEGRDAVAVGAVVEFRIRRKRS